MTIFRAACLTPVHIGTGEVMNLLEYKLEAGRLYSLDLSRFLMDLRDDGRQKFEALTDRNDIMGLRRFIAENCDAGRYANRAVRVGEGFAREYEKKFGDLRNQMEVHPFMGSEQNGKNYVPGSSLKGAIRTAVVNRYAQEGDRRNLESASRGGQRGGFEGAVLDCTILTDPFRVVKAGDADLPEDSTEIAAIKNCVVSAGGGLTPHLAPLWCEVSGSRLTGTPVEFDVEITMDARAREIGGRYLSKKIRMREVAMACNRFYRKRLTWEFEKFYSRDPKAGPAGKRLMEERFGGGSFLLRIGRFSHFESLSVDGFRRGYDRRKKKPITEGSTRNLYQGFLPLGWIKLTPKP